jgi:hypothetical protein
MPVHVVGLPTGLPAGPGEGTAELQCLPDVSKTEKAADQQIGIRTDREAIRPAEVQKFI